MKFESLALGVLFVACFTVCALVMGAMLEATPASAQLTASTTAPASITRTAPCHTLLLDGVVCRRSHA